LWTGDDGVGTCIQYSTVIGGLLVVVVKQLALMVVVQRWYGDSCLLQLISRNHVFLFDPDVFLSKSGGGGGGHNRIHLETSNVASLDK
jgi:hypothetical protein